MAQLWKRIHCCANGGEAVAPRGQRASPAGQVNTMVADLQASLRQHGVEPTDALLTDILSPGGPAAARVSSSEPDIP